MVEPHKQLQQVCCPGFAVAVAAVAVAVAVVAPVRTASGQSGKLKVSAGLVCTEPFCARIGQWVPSTATDGTVAGLILRYVGSALGDLGMMVGDVIVGVNEKRFSDAGLGLAEELRALFEKRTPMNLVVMRGRTRLMFRYTGKE